MTSGRKLLSLLVLGIALGSAVSCVPEAAGVAPPGPQLGNSDPPEEPVTPDPGDGPATTRGDVPDRRDDGASGVEQQPTPAPATLPPDDPPADGDPCSAAALGDGGYCAQSLDPTSSASKLYTCVGRQTASVIVCPDGCQITPDGVNDVCASAPRSPPIVPTASCSASKAGDCGGDTRWCTNDGQCRSCASGMFNCNGVFGCECRFGCHGGGCLQCSPDAAFSCSGNNSWCYQGQCRLCTQGFFNCDGRAGCECSGGCDGSKCR